MSARAGDVANAPNVSAMTTAVKTVDHVLVQCPLAFIIAPPSAAPLLVLRHRASRLEFMRLATGTRAAAAPTLSARFGARHPARLAPPKRSCDDICAARAYFGGDKAALPCAGKHREKRRRDLLNDAGTCYRPALPIRYWGSCMAGLRVRVLGDFEARVGTGPALSLSSRKSRALLAYLAVIGQHPQTREKLAALLWGEVPEEQARQSLRKALWDLRHALADAEPPPLSTGSETIALITETVDALQFEALMLDGRPDALRDAMALYRGDLLEGLRVDEPSFEEWLTRERERFRRLAVDALERLLE